MSLLARLGHIDRRLIFVCVFLAVAVPLLVEFDFPVRATPSVRAVYDQVEQVAARRGTALLCFSYGGGAEPELQPMARALLRHLFSRDVKVVAMCLWPDAVGLAQDALQSAAAEMGKAYGRDYAFVGFKPGMYAVVINMGQDFRATFPADNYGASTDTLEVTRPIHSLSDFGFVFDLAAGASLDGLWIPFGQEKYHFPLAGGVTAVMAPDLFPFLQSGQLKGMVGGLAGAAEYEALVAHPGEATEGMRPQSVAHLVIAFFILFGNAVHFLSRKLGTGAP